MADNDAQSAAARTRVIDAYYRRTYSWVRGNANAPPVSSTTLIWQVYRPGLSDEAGTSNRNTADLRSGAVSSVACTSGVSNARMRPRKNAMLVITLTGCDGS